MRSQAAVAAVVMSLVVPAVGGSGRLFGQAEIDRIVSRVNNSIITQSDIREAMSLRLVDDPATENSTRQCLENRMLILAEIGRLPPLPPASEKDFAARRAEWEAGIGGHARAGELLGRTSMKDSALDGWLRDDVRIQMQLKRQFGNVSDADRSKAVEEWIARLRQRAGLK